MKSGLFQNSLFKNKLLFSIQNASPILQKNRTAWSSANTLIWLKHFVKNVTAFQEIVAFENYSKFRGLNFYLIFAHVIFREFKLVLDVTRLREQTRISSF